MSRIRWLIWTKHLDTNEKRKQNHKTSKKKPKKNKNRIAEPTTPKHIMVFLLKIILMLCERSLNPGEGGTLGIFGWRCAAETLKPLGFTRASSSEFCYPTLD